jgi:hypothetical protein
MGQPTGTLAPREGAREAGMDSPEAGSVVWPLPPPPPLSGLVTTTPPPPLSGDSSTAPPPQDPAAAGEQPPLWSPIGGRILCRFTHLVKPSRPGRRSGVGDGVERRGATLARRASEVHRGGGGDEVGNQRMFP